MIIPILRPSRSLHKILSTSSFSSWHYGFVDWTAIWNGAFHHFYGFTMCYPYGHVFVLGWDYIECSISFHIHKWLPSLSFAVTKGDGRIPDIFVILELEIHIIMSFRSLLYGNRTYNLLQHVSSNRQIILHTFF